MVICAGCWTDEEAIKSIGIRALSAHRLMIIGLSVLIALCCVTTAMSALMT